MSELRTYLRGEHSLGRTFFLFALMPRAVIWLGLMGLGMWPYPWLAVLLPLLAVDLALFVLQLRAVNRSCEAHLRSHGSMAALWGGYLGMLFLAAMSVTLWWGLILAALTPPETESYADQTERLRRETYSLTVSEDGGTLVFSGEITFGLTKRIKAALRETPDIQRITLTSKGGHIYEARGVAQVVQQSRLATHVPDECSSACTLIFIAGHPRTLGPDARLGFHQYALNFKNALPSVDIAHEQAKDRAFFEGRGVAPEFLAKMFDQTSDGLWFPPRELLETSGVLSP